MTTQVDQNRGDEDGRISQAQSYVQPKDTKSLTVVPSKRTHEYLLENRRLARMGLRDLISYVSVDKDGEILMCFYKPIKEAR